MNPKSRLLLTWIVLLILAYPFLNASAQQVIFALNMNDGYAPQGAYPAVPIGWTVFVDWGMVQVYRHEDPRHVRSSPYSWAFRSDFVVFEAGAIHREQSAPGTSYRFVAYAMIWTCDNAENFCLVNDQLQSDRSAEASVRVGIDPTGATDPAAGTVVWGAWVPAYDAFHEVSIEVTAQADYITLFVMTTEKKGLIYNESYWEDFSLMITDGSGVINASGTAAPPPPAEVPFVVPQAPRPDGSLVHVVAPNDTLYSIIFAYANLGVTMETLMEANGWEYRPDFITVGQEIIILPPGSIDPATGQLLRRAGETGSPTATLPPSPTAISQGTVGEAAATPASETASSSGSPVTVIEPFLPRGSLK